MSFLDRVRTCNDFEPADYLPFVVAGHAVGLVRPSFAAALVEFTGVFEVDDRGVALVPDLQTPEERTEAVDAVLRGLAERGVIRHWRDERYPVATAFSAPPLMTMERAAVPLFGIRAYGLHVNGIVRDGDEIRMWIGRRSADRAAERARDTDDFKFNCSLVVIDFLICHGRIAPDHPDYLEIIAGLHSE